MCVKFVGFTLPPGRTKVKGRIRLRGQSTAFQYGRHRNATRFRARHTQRFLFVPVPHPPRLEITTTAARRPHYRITCYDWIALPPPPSSRPTPALRVATAVTAVLRDRRLPGEEETTVVVVGGGPAVREKTVLPQSTVYVPPRRPITRTRVFVSVLRCVCVCLSSLSALTTTMITRSPRNFDGILRYR